MTDSNVHLALFDEVDPASEAVDKLRGLGIPDEAMTILSGVPYSEAILGRPKLHSFVPLFAAFGAIGGLIAGIALNFGTPLLYPNYVGRQPLLPIPTAIVVTFETTMLGLLLFTFLGVIWESAFPAFGKQEYHPGVSDGKIALVFNCAPGMEARAYDTLTKLGVQKVQRTEAKNL